MASTRWSGITITALHLSDSQAINKVEFEELVDVSIQHSFTTTWGSEQSYGRMDKMANFSGTSRSVQLSLNVKASNTDDQIKLNRQIETLFQFLYPTYNSQGTALTSPPFFRFSFFTKKLFVDLDGYITDFKVKPGHTDDTMMKVVGDRVYEKQYSIDLTFTPLDSAPTGWVDGVFKTGKAGLVYDTEPDGGDAGWTGATADAAFATGATVGEHASAAGADVNSSATPGGQPKGVSGGPFSRDPSEIGMTMADDGRSETA